jgi:hypothetical protein
LGAAPLPQSAGFVRAAPAPFRSAMQALTQCGPSPSALPHIDPLDLPARALAILSEDRATKAESRPVFLPLQRRTLEDGTTCSLPLRYFDARCLIASFPADLRRATALLEHTGLNAVAREDGNATVLFGCFEYRDSDLGPYNEVGLSILATAPGDRTPALYVVNLPVTTAVTNRAGRELWGYDKFVATIDIKGNERAFSTTLRDARAGTIAVLGGGLGACASAPPADLPTFSVFNGKVLKTKIQVLTPSRIGSGDGFTLKLGASTHRMAGNLRGLGLDGASPAMVQYADPFQALLFPGVAV